MDACCGGTTPAEDEYPYRRAGFVDGEVRTPAGPVPRVSTTRTAADLWGRLRVRLGVLRDHYRIAPGLYAAGSPDASSPVLVTANYKLSFDTLRFELDGIDAWILVLDTKGINVWCAAGKGTFGTRELAERVHAVRLFEVVDHRTLILPQLGAPGIAAPVIPKLCGFSVVYGPVRASDLPEFLAQGMQATPAMRRVTFSLGERLVLTPVELSVVANPKVLAGVAIVVALSAFGARGLDLAGLPGRMATLLGIPAVALAAGAFVTPMLLPWIPGRAFSLKGALVGAAGAVILVFGLGAGGSAAGAVSVFALVTAVASFTAMNFTGATTFTSPTGVLWEMRRALPWQAAGLAVALVALVASFLIG